MDRLTYEQRKRAIFEFLYGKDGGLLRRYRTPEYMSDDALRDEVNMLVEDINQHIPSGLIHVDFHKLLPMINAAIRQRQGSQGWPLAKVFITATEDAVAALGRQKAVITPAKFSFDSFEIIAKKMRTGEGVGETYLWGRQSVELLERKLVDQATMERYRVVLFSKHKEHHGETVAKCFEDEAKAQHKAAQEEYRGQKSDA